MNPSDREILRGLAGRWMELASLPVMSERKRLWTALKDLRPERPMLLFEVWTLGEHFVASSELECSTPELRNLELHMRRMIRQVEVIGDDLVLEPRLRLSWHTQASTFGVDITETHANDAHGGDVAYSYNHPIRTPEDVARLHPRTFTVDREATLLECEELSGAVGDLLPVQIDGIGGIHVGLTWELFRLIGNDNLLAWVYDAPEVIHQLMAFLRDDRIARYTWMEAEGLLAPNNSNLVGSGSPGYTTALPASAGGPYRLTDMWDWMDSQETSMISPRMFERFFLPYMAEVAGLFGLTYYGCCEPVHDRWARIKTAIPNIRAVSISPWCNQRIMGEVLAKTCVFSRKPKPWLISEDVPDWSAMEQDLDETLAATRDGCLEIIYRDVYRISDRAHLRRWAEMVRSRVGGSFQ